MSWTKRSVILVELNNARLSFHPSLTNAWPYARAITGDYALEPPDLLQETKSGKVENTVLFVIEVPA